MLRKNSKIDKDFQVKDVKQSSKQLKGYLFNQQSKQLDKFQVTSEQNKALIFQHNLEKQQESNFLLRALKMKRQQDGKLPKIDEEIDDQTYRNAIVANEESQNEFSVARKKISIKDWILYPTNKYLLRLNFLSCTLVFYDCFMVPFKNTYGS